MKNGIWLTCCLVIVAMLGVGCASQAIDKAAANNSPMIEQAPSLLLALAQGQPTGSPVSIRSFLCDDGSPVVGDGQHDDTSGIQAALNTRGKTIVFPPGTYRVTSTLRMSGNFPIVISAEPGAIFQFAPKDDSTVCLELTTRGDPVVRKGIYGLTIVGPRPNDPPKDASHKPGEMIGLKIFETQRGELANVRIIGFDGVGLLMDHCYYWSVRNLDVRYNGWGVKCIGANATSFYYLQAQYNIYGYENIQSLIGGAVEANFRSGARYTEVGGRFSIHDVWFEQNNLANTLAGEADIWANDPEGEWMPVVLSISGCTTFHNVYSSELDARAVPTHNIVGCMQLALSGAVRFFEPNRWHSFKLHPWSTIIDGSAGNAMMEVKNGFSGPVNYARPEVKRVETPGKAPKP